LQMMKDDREVPKATFRCTQCGSHAVEVEGLIEILLKQAKVLDEIREAVKDLWEHAFGELNPDI